MVNNKKLIKANKAKKDEFYTMLSDIEAELKHYDFSGKIVYCNCDDGFRSNFFNYFMFNFEKLNIKKLICTGFGEETDRVFIMKNKNYALFAPHNGDFRKNIEFLKEADVIVTNPPFSLFREYIAQLVKYNKKFIILGNMNAVTYKNIFPLIKENKLFLGFSIHSGDRKFCVPKNYPLNANGTEIDKRGNKYIRVTSVRWFTNLKRYNGFLELKAHYSPEKYHKYENFEAINVDKTKDIPSDYFGTMGVPITFLDKYNPEQFRIIGFKKGVDGKLLNYIVDGKRKIPYFRILIKKVKK